MAVRMGTAQARWVLAAAVLGSGIAFLDGTIVNVALPVIARNLHSTIEGLQWILNGYLVTLSALLLLGGSLGDRFGRRRVFVLGLVGFSAGSLLCAVAPTTDFLVITRAVQGVGGALLVPGSLAIIAATFSDEDRGAAVGAWSGLAGVTSAVGPFLGGWLVDAVSWRLIFVINLPLAAISAAIAWRHVPETRSDVRRPLDLPGSVLATASLAAICYAAIDHSGVRALVVGSAGFLAAVGFVLLERRTAHPVLPLDLFRSRQFSGTNLTTLAVYGALGAALFLVVLRLQDSLGYSALDAGVALLPITAIMFLLSRTAGRVGQRIGARWPMTVGPILAAGGLLLLARLGPGMHYPTDVLPGVLMFGFGLTVTVAPLTAAVLGSVDRDRAGTASGVNNAAARFAGLIAVAVLPAVAGIAGHRSIGAGLAAGYGVALAIAAGLCALGGVIAALLVRETRRLAPVTQPSAQHSCVGAERPDGGVSARRAGERVAG
jgi:EmrB/QacA subfamily drug resistance transporter